MSNSFEEMFKGWTMPQGCQQSKSEKKLTVNVEHYNKLEALMDCYKRSLEKIERMEESIDKDCVYSARLERFKVDQHKARLVWIKEEINRLVNE